MYVTAGGLYVSRGHPDAVRKVFDSEKEWKRWLVLLAELKAGLISGLQRQKSYKLHGPNGTVITRYVADFVYIRNGRRVVEDIKSPMTKKLATYRYKVAWMKDEYGIDIYET